MEKTTTQSIDKKRQASSTWQSVGQKEHQKLPLQLRAIRWTFSRLGPLAPGLFSRLMAKLWFRPRRFRIPGREKKILDQARVSFYQTLHGHNIPVYSWGEGQAVFLAHGWESRAGQFYAIVEQLVEAGYKVVGFDSPGHGKAEGERTDLSEYVTTMLHLQEQFGKPAAVVAHSFGAICSLFAVNRGLDSSRLVLLGPPAEVDILVDAFAEMLAIPQVVVARFRKIVDKMFLHFSDDIWAEMSPSAAARRIHQPVLVIHDQDDQIVPFADGKKLCRQFSNGRLQETRGLGHQRILRDSETVARIADFVGTVGADQ